MKERYAEYIRNAQERFAAVLEEQLDRVEAMKRGESFVDYSSLDKVTIGVVGGDGIGPAITEQAHRVLRFLLKDQEAAGKVAFKVIDGLTIERRIEEGKAIPDDVLAELKACDVILKGPTTTPNKVDGGPNIESANVAMRRALDLFANVRPVKVPEQGIDWMFFRENTEGAYVLGSKGTNVTEDLAIDFAVTTTQGTERIVRLAFDYARRNGIRRVTAVTKANVVKTTDGKFLEIAYRIAKEYPEIRFDDWYIDIMTAALVNPRRRTEFRVFVLPNLYGDILTDEAAEFQGGVGTAGSANIGKRYAMFEAIHGSAPRMVNEGRAQYANPSSIIRAAAMLLDHIGYKDEADRLQIALDICGLYEKRLVMTGHSDGATCSQYADYLVETLSDPALRARWDEYRSRAASR